MSTFATRVWMTPLKNIPRATIAYKTIFNVRKHIKIWNIHNIVDMVYEWRPTIGLRVSMVCGDAMGLNRLLVQTWALEDLQKGNHHPIGGTDVVLAQTFQKLRLELTKPKNFKNNGVFRVFLSYLWVKEVQYIYRGLF